MHFLSMKRARLLLQCNGFFGEHFLPLVLFLLHNTQLCECPYVGKQNCTLSKASVLVKETCYTHNQFEQIILDVPGAVANGERRGVREDDWRLRALQSVHGSLVGGVRQVDYHAQPVQLLYHSLVSREMETWTFH